ncbi:MAG: hypothetical protein IAG13_25480 [Deltaproteobacteria bacterium]|nr:hypothetical protein [Nannocystaceae bacterium]
MRMVYQTGMSFLDEVGVERGVALETQDVLTADNLSPLRSRRAAAAIVSDEVDFNDGVIDLEQRVADLERKLINAGLKKTGGVRKEAAKLLGVSFRSMRYRLEKLGIEVAKSDADDG